MDGWIIISLVVPRRASSNIIIIYYFVDLKNIILYIFL